MLTRAAFLFLCIWTFAAIVHGGVAGVVEWPQSSPGLLNGTYIAAGPDSWRELADYLDSNPEAHISRLLLSDSPGIASGSNATATESCQNISTLAHRILDHTSSSLTALSYLAYVCNDTSLPGSILERELPNLTELTLGATDVWRYQDALFRKKSLTHLHCASYEDDLPYDYNVAPPSLAVVLQQLRNLSHFRVSALKETEMYPS